MLRLSEDAIAGHITFLQRSRTPMVVVMLVTTVMLLIPTVVAKFASSEAVANGPSESELEAAKATDEQTDNSIEAIEAKLNSSGNVANKSNHGSRAKISPRTHQSGGGSKFIKDSVERYSVKLGRSLGENLSQENPVQKQVAGSVKSLAVWAATRQFQKRTRNVSNTVIPESDQLIIRNPATNSGQISFLLDGKVVSLTSGEERRLPSSKTHSIQFHRGGSFGVGKHLLQRGTHEFSATSEGWQLVSEDAN